MVGEHMQILWGAYYTIMGTIFCYFQNTGRMYKEKLRNVSTDVPLEPCCFMLGTPDPDTDPVPFNV